METGKEAWPSPLPQYEFYKQLQTIKREIMVKAV